MLFRSVVLFGCAVVGLAACEPQPSDLNVDAIEAGLVEANQPPTAQQIAAVLAQRDRRMIGIVLAEGLRIFDVRAEGSVLIYEFQIATDVTNVPPARVQRLASELRPLFAQAVCNADRGANSLFDAGVSVRTVLRDIRGTSIDAFDVEGC